MARICTSRCSAPSTHESAPDQITWPRLGHEQLGALVSTIGLINSFNRANVIVRQPAIDYQPEQLKSMVADIEQR